MFNSKKIADLESRVEELFERIHKLEEINTTLSRRTRYLEGVGRDASNIRVRVFTTPHTEFLRIAPEDICSVNEAILMLFDRLKVEVKKSSAKQELVNVKPVRKGK